ncbi:hypothetical protein ACFOMD_06225 [Sphingoaurantiacus capsulatus]|uniref:Uncharacterized protein n=1 Tax=Sphingoaurantiacus capsulatus TaxID=1771310 RepID=A0ABV7X7R5_9SPHN
MAARKKSKAREVAEEVGAEIGFNILLEAPEAAARIALSATRATGRLALDAGEAVLDAGGKLIEGVVEGVGDVL